MVDTRYIKKTPLMEQYEEETGKLAIWKGEVSQQFEKWKKKKGRESIRKQKLEIISQSREEKKKMKREAKSEKIAGKDYDHLIVGFLGTYVILIKLSRQTMMDTFRETF